MFYAQHPVFGFRIGPVFETREACVLWAKQIFAHVTSEPVPDSELKRRYDAAVVRLEGAKT